MVISLHQSPGAFLVPAAWSQLPGPFESSDLFLVIPAASVGSGNVACLWCESWLLVLKLFLTHVPVAYAPSGLRISLCLKKLLRPPKGFCL